MARIYTSPYVRARDLREWQVTLVERNAAPFMAPGGAGARLQLALADRYEIERELGSGGMATVFLARDLRHFRFVAIKVLRAELASGVSAERFELEIRVAARLAHPHILPLHDSGVAGDDLFYVMPYVEGESLRDRLRRVGRLPLTDALGISREVAGALDYAHRQGVIHRDIKPENILLLDGHAVVADFGLAKAIGGEDGTAGQKMTLAGVALGTPAYMSPEQADGGASIDGRSDIYSLGCVMYEMFTGRVPFDEESVRATIFQHFTAAPAPPSRFRRDIPASVERAILRALAKAPADRFANASELAGAVDNGEALPAASRSARLPHTTEKLIGREHELARVEELTRSRRLVTLLGPGGIGKTRLAIGVAESIASRGERPVTYVPLVSVPSADLVPAAVANAMGAVFSQSRDAVEQLVEYLRQRDDLIILDNFEHLEAAATLVSTIMGEADRVTLLVTSRERLGLSDETVFELAGLSWTASGGPAIALFAQKAAMNDPSFALTAATRQLAARVCAHVGGLPLGIELAASMLRVLTIEELATELDRTLDAVVTPLRDVPERHRSLHALFESAWVRLSGEARDALMRLAVLHGSFSREAAEQVGGASLPLLLTLVDKSLVYRPTPGRYAIHEVLRRCAEGKLHASRDTRFAAERAHAGYFARFLADREQALLGGDQARVLDEITTDIDNVRAAWNWAAENDERTLLGASLSALSRFYFMRRWAHEGARVLEIPVTAGDSPLAGRLLARQAYFLYASGRHGEARTAFRRALRILRRDGEMVEMLDATRQLAALPLDTGRPAAAARLVAGAIATARRHGIARELSALLYTFGVAAVRLGRYREAESAFNECTGIRRAAGDQWGTANALVALCLLAATQERLVEARQCILEARDIAHLLGDPHLLGQVLINFADLLMREEKLDEARATASQGLALFREVGERHGAAVCLLTLGEVALRLRQYSDAARWVGEALDLSLAAHAPSVTLGASFLAAVLALEIGAQQEATYALRSVVEHTATDDVVRERARTLLAGRGSESVSGAVDVGLEEIADRTRNLLAIVVEKGKR